MPFIAKLKSRKFLLVVVTFVVGFCSEAFGWDLDPNVIYGYVLTALAFIGVEGLADNNSRKLDGAFSVKMLQAQLNDLLEQRDVESAVSPADSSIGAHARSIASGAEGV